MTGIKPKTKEEKEAAKATKKDTEKDNPPVITPTDQEREIVSMLKKGLDVKPIALNDLSHKTYLEKAQFAYRRELTDVAYEKRNPYASQDWNTLHGYIKLFTCSPISSSCSKNISQQRPELVSLLRALGTPDG